jgi:putative DNA primase/helicase
MSAGRKRAGRVDFEAVAAAALPHLPALVARWLPGGRLEGREWTCASLAGGAGRSCRVNVVSGRWADFSTDQRGGDAVSLAAAIAGVSQLEAARRLSEMLGIDGGRP